MEKILNSEKLHILICCQYFFPERFRINDIAQEWIKRGYRVTVLTGIPNYPEGKFFEGYGLTKKRREVWNGIDIIRIPLIPRGNNSIGLILNYLSFPISGLIWNFFTKIKADFVFMFETSPMNQCKVGVAYARKHHVPCLLYVQDLWPENVEMMTGISSPLVIKPIERMVRKIYKGCDMLLATSPTFVKEIQKRVDKNEWDKVVYWPQYAEEFYVPVDVGSASGDAVDINKTKELKIVFTGNIGQAQGLEILPQVAALLKKRFEKTGDSRKVTFTLVGDGRGRANLENEITRLGVEDSFKFTGRKQPEEIPEILSQYDVAFISFMNTDLFAKTIPAKLQSYMACGMPILASAVGETARIIDEAGCGISCAIGNPEALEESIITFLEMPCEDLQRMRKNSINYSKTHFDKKVLMDMMDRWIEKLTR